MTTTSLETTEREAIEPTEPIVTRPPEQHPPLSDYDCWARYDRWNYPQDDIEQKLRRAFAAGLAIGAKSS